MKDYLEVNRQVWDNRVEVHLNSEMYDMEAFMNGKSSVPILDLQLLGDIRGKTILHLQCHFGMDTISLARLGAKIVGVDFSQTAILTAKELNKTLNQEVDFFCCDIYNISNVITQKFDIVYTSYGVINWLPDLQRWGKLISQLLIPNGKFIMVEFHPILWMFNETFDKIDYPYSRSTPYKQYEKTYTENGNQIIGETITWNHGVSQPINGLSNNGLVIQKMNEYYYSPINLFGNMIEVKKDQFKLKGMEDKLPITYSIEAIKPQ